MELPNPASLTCAVPITPSSRVHCSYLRPLLSTPTAPTAGALSVTSKEFDDIDDTEKPPASLGIIPNRLTEGSAVGPSSPADS
jgi:hypothetical protein